MWINIWTACLIVGLGSFYLVVLIVIPLGARDIRRLFSTLDEADQARQESTDRST